MSFLFGAVFCFLILEIICSRHYHSPLSSLRVDGLLVSNIDYVFFIIVASVVTRETIFCQLNFVLFSQESPAARHALQDSIQIFQVAF